MDRSPSIWIERKVHSTERREHRSRKGRTAYTYHMYLEPIASSNELHIPQHIQIDSIQFGRAKAGAKVKIEIGSGRLNLPWYKSFTFDSSSANI